MSHAARCLHCNHDLSNAAASGAAAVRCPACGAEQPGATRSPGPPPRRPAPPTRDATAAAAWATAESPASAPERSNPFLDLGSAPVFESAPVAAVPAAVATPRVLTPAAGAPLRVHPGAVAPSLGDPHAEFRKGRWQRPLAFALVGAAALAGLFFLAPGEKKTPTADLTVAPDRAEAKGIGSSLPPERIVEDKTELTEHKARFEERAAAANDKEPPARPAGIAADTEFSRAFKAAASH